jgi:hypothetical protein
MKRSIYQGLGWDPRQAARFEAEVLSRTAETENFRECVRSAGETRAEPSRPLPALSAPLGKATRASMRPALSSSTG